MFNKQTALEAIGTIIELKNGLKEARQVAKSKIESYRSVYGEFTGESLGQFQFVDSNLDSKFIISQAKKLLSRKVIGEVPELLSEFYPTCKVVSSSFGCIYIGDQIQSKIDFQLLSSTVKILNSSEDSLDLFEEEVVPTEEFIDKTSVKYNDDKVDEIVDYLAAEGESKDQSDSEFDLVQLATGVLVELEHSDNFDVAKEIAKDHLAEDPEYYSKYFFPDEAIERIEDIKDKITHADIGHDPDFSVYASANKETKGKYIPQSKFGEYDSLPEGMDSWLEFYRLMEPEKVAEIETILKEPGNIVKDEYELAGEIASDLGYDSMWVYDVIKLIKEENR